MPSALNQKESSLDSVSLLGLTKNSDNYGVQVLLSSAIQLIALGMENPRVFLLDYGKAPEAWQEPTPNGPVSVELVNMRFSWRFWLPNSVFLLLLIVASSYLIPVSRWRRIIWNLNSCLRRALQAKVYLSIAGGDSFSDIYGFRRFLYVTLPQVLVLLLGKPLVLLPQTYGPFKTVPARWIAKALLLRSHKIFSRDEAGRATVEALLKPHKRATTFLPDIGFSLHPSPLPQATRDFLTTLRSAGPLIGLNPSKLLYMGGYTRANMFGLSTSFKDLIDSLVDHIVNNLQAIALLIPHVRGGTGSQEDESSLCESIVAELTPRYNGRVAYLDEHLDPAQTKSLLGECEVFVGARMHACIGAVSQGVPSLCLAYSDKFAGVMQAFAPAARVVDLRKTTPEATASQLTDLFRHRDKLRIDLATKLPLAVRQTQTAFTELLRSC